MTLLKSGGRSKKSITETTEILKSFGLATSDNVTRRLVRENKLKGIPKGKVATDKRSGYEIYERDIYKYVVEEIPVMKEIFAKLEELESIQNKTKKTIKEIAK